MIGIIVHTRIILLSYHHFINEEMKAQGSPKIAQIVDGRERIWTQVCLTPTSRYLRIDDLTVAQLFLAVVDKNEFHSSIRIWLAPGN